MKLTKILIIYPGALGDTLLTRPAIYALKRHFSKSEIDFIGIPEFVRLLQKDLNQIFDYNSSRLLSLFSQTSDLDSTCRDWFNDYDVIIFWATQQDKSIFRKLQSVWQKQIGSTEKTPKIIYDSIKPPEDYQKNLSDFVLQTLRPIGIEPRSKSRLNMPGLSVKPALLKDFPAQPFAVVHPGSGGSKKNLPASIYRELMTLLTREFQVNVICVLGPAEEKLRHEFQQGSWHVFQTNSLAELAGLLQLSEFYVGNDSGVSHLAGQIGTKTFVIFVATNPIVWAPIGKQVFIFHKQKALPEKPNFYELNNFSAAEIMRYLKGVLRQ